MNILSLLTFFILQTFAIEPILIQETRSFPSEEIIKTTQKYDTTLQYIIQTSTLEPNSFYEIKVHTLGSIPTIFGVSLKEPKHYEKDTNFFDESNLQFHTNEKKCIILNGKEECGEIVCYVTLLYMGRTVYPNELEKGVTYFITLKKGPLGLPGNIPILVALGICCIIVSLVGGKKLLNYFDSLSSEENMKKK